MKKHQNYISYFKGMKEGEKIDRQIDVQIYTYIQNEREINNYIDREFKRKKIIRKKEKEKIREKQRFMNRKKLEEKE